MFNIEPPLDEMPEPQAGSGMRFPWTLAVLPAAVLGGVIAATAGGLLYGTKSQHTTTSPSSFVAESPAHPFEKARTIANMYHKGMKEFGSDRDYSGDGKNDLYLVANDGTIFHTDSSEPRSLNLAGTDDLFQDTNWYKLQEDSE